jgi:hypothetical protein
MSGIRRREFITLLCGVAACPRICVRFRSTALWVAKAAAFFWLAGGGLAAETKDTMAVMGADFWKYGVHENLPEIEALSQYVFEQGLVDRKIAVEELFAPATFEMAKV